MIYCWNIFSTIIFVQECLKRFGEPGDQFVLTYRDKDEKETAADENEVAAQEELVQQFKGYRNPFSSMLIESKNIIFRGAPGTGKSYLAKEIAADIISDGYFDDYTLLTAEQKKQVEFVQFHPSYDYSDFVEGLRPKVNDDGSMGFELQDGVFKKFVARARKNYEDSQKSKEVVEQEALAQDAMDSFFADIELGEDKFKTTKGSEFLITGIDEKHIDISIPGNESVNKLRLSVDEIRAMLESGKNFEKISDITAFVGIKNKDTRIIADAKYKPIDNIGNKDYLQILAYMFRFDAKRGYYFYPEAEGTDDLQLWMNMGSTYEENVRPRDDISITKHGLKIPADAENYESFVTRMKTSECDFRETFAV